MHLFRHATLHSRFRYLFYVKHYVAMVVIYPLGENKLPSILKRISFVPLMVAPVSFSCLVLKISSLSSESSTEWIAHFLSSFTKGFTSQLILTSVLEFMCAQSPYNMRGLLSSLTQPVGLFSICLGWTVGFVLTHYICKQTWCPLVSLVVKTSSWDRQ